jgi:hypothetical protein
MISRHEGGSTFHATKEHWVKNCHIFYEIPSNDEEALNFDCSDIMLAKTIIN